MAAAPYAIVAAESPAKGAADWASADATNSPKDFFCETVLGITVVVVVVVVVVVATLRMNRLEGVMVVVAARPRVVVGTVIGVVVVRVVVVSGSVDGIFRVG